VRRVELLCVGVRRLRLRPPRPLLLLALALAGAAARAQETPSPEKKAGVAAVSSPSEAAAARAKAVPLPDAPADLAKLLAVYDRRPEPQRELSRLYASALYYLLDRNLERYLLCFHEDFELDESGSVSKLPLPDLKTRVEALWEKVPKSELKLDELVLLDKARVYSKQQAKHWAGNLKKEPSEIARVMQDGDWLVLAPLSEKARGAGSTDFDTELFFVFRKQDGVWKIALGE